VLTGHPKIGVDLALRTDRTVTQALALSFRPAFEPIPRGGLT
jgi:hypothetical protein